MEAALPLLLLRRRGLLALLPCLDQGGLLLPLQPPGQLRRTRGLSLGPKPLPRCHRGQAERLLRAGASLPAMACSNINLFGPGWH